MTKAREAMKKRVRPTAHKPMPIWVVLFFGGIIKYAGDRRSVAVAVLNAERAKNAAVADWYRLVRYLPRPLPKRRARRTKP